MSASRSGFFFDESVKYFDGLSELTFGNQEFTLDHPGGKITRPFFKDFIHLLFGLCQVSVF